MHRRRNLRVVVAPLIAGLTLVLAGGLVAAEPAAASVAAVPAGSAATGSGAVPAAGTYYPVPAVNLLTGGSITEASPAHEQVLGMGRVPASGVSAVVVMMTVTAVRENAEDIYADAKAINQQRAQQEADAVIEDASEAE